MANDERKISASKLLMMLSKKFRNRIMIHYDDLMAAIADVPTVDAVEVVRCKDCKECFTRANGTTYCRRTGRYAATADFCSYGERRSGE